MAWKQPIPTEYLRPLIEKYIEENAHSTLLEHVGAARRLLAERARMDFATFTDIRTGRVEEVDLDVADRLLCAMRMVHKWRVPPLSEHYFGPTFCGKGHQIASPETTRRCAVCHKEHRRKSRENEKRKRAAAAEALLAA